MPRLFSFSGYKAFGCILLWCSLSVSCKSGGNAYAVIHDFKAGEWQRNEPLTFTYSNSDTLSEKNMVLNIRFLDNFPFDRINLEIRTFRPDNVFWTDTLSIPLTDTTGAWDGKKLISIIDREQTVREGIIFGMQGEYMIQVRHLMGEPPLKHIVSLGILLN